MYSDLVINRSLHTTRKSQHFQAILKICFQCYIHISITMSLARSKLQLHNNVLPVVKNAIQTHMTKWKYQSWFIFQCFYIRLGNLMTASGKIMTSFTDSTILSFNATNGITQKILRYGICYEIASFYDLDLCVLLSSLFISN